METFGTLIVWGFAMVGIVFIGVGLSLYAGDVRDRRERTRRDREWRGRLMDAAKWCCEDEPTAQLLEDIANRTRIDVARDRWRKARAR